MAVDALQLLREYAIAKRPVGVEGDDLVFGEVRVPRATETGFRSLKGQGAPYALEACWFLLQHADTKFADYLAECSRHRIPKVSLVDKKDLLAYLTGRSSAAALPHLSLTTPLAAPSPADLLLAPSPAPAKRSAADAQLDSARLEEEASQGSTTLSSAQHHQALLLQGDEAAAASSSVGSLPKKARLEPQDIELDERLKESKRLVARRLEQPKGVASAKQSSSSSSSSAMDALPYLPLLGRHGSRV